MSRDPAIRRSIVIGDVLYTVSAKGIQASALSTTDTLAWMSFPQLPKIVAFLPLTYIWESGWIDGANRAA